MPDQPEDRTMPRGLLWCLGGGVVAVVAVAAMLPESPVHRDRRVDGELEAGDVAKVAEAPDGATVWAVRREGRTIYFSKGAVAIEQPTQTGAS